jgi:acyl phosphate:glycerol-3-phosphate acyltransferase
VFAPFYQMLIWGMGPIVLSTGLMGLLLVWRHQANIKKLLNGTESKIGQKSAAAAAAGTNKKHPHGQGPKAPGHSHHHPKPKEKKQ